MAITTTLNLSISVGDDQGNSPLILQPGRAQGNSPSGIIYTGILNEYLQVFVIGVAAPTNLAAAGSTTGGSFSAGTYYWEVTGLNGAGETVGSNEVTLTLTGSTSSVQLVWNAMPGASSYRVYRGTASGSESHYQAASTNSFTDTGTTGSSGTVPVSNTTGTTWTPTLPMTPLQFVYVRNMPLSAGNLTVTWTPTGGSSAAVIVLAPGGEINYIEPSIVSGGGISAIAFSTTAEGTLIEANFTA